MAEGGTLGVIVLLLIVLASLIGGLGSGIASDWRIRHDAVAAPDVGLKEGGCRPWLVVFKFCSVTLVANEDGREPTLWYAFFDAPGERPVALVRGRSEPARITTSFGLETVYSRALTLLVFASLLAACIGAAGSVLWKGLLARRAFARMSGMLTPVVVEIERNNRLPPRRRLWVYLYEEGGRRERALAEWPSAKRPLFTSGDERWALAIRGEAGGAPMLLDANLEDLDLTDAERARFRQAFRAAFGWAEP
jgi:hypothetical protein